MKSDIDLEQIIELAASGDSKCCEQLVLHITPKIQTYIFRSTLDSGITEDLSQEVFCKMLGALSTLNDVNSFWPWLYRIASNCVNTYYRKRTKHDRIVNYQQGLLGSVGKVENSVDAELMSKELELAVMEAVATLKPKHRQIINLRCLEDMSFKEISRIERTSEVYTRVLFHRTLERLRITLEKQGFQKVSLVLALSIFGSLTSVSKAAATGVSVTAASVTGIGTVKGLSAITAKLIKIFSTVSVHQAKLTVAAVVIAAIITTVATTGPLPSDVTSIHYVIQGVTPASDQTANAAQANKNASSSSSSSFSSSSSSSSLGSDAAGTQYQTKGAYENKLYMPQGPQGPVMRFMQRWNIEQTGKLCSWLQDGSGYYYYAAGEDKTYITNDPLKMLILPTDPPELVKFIHSQAGYDSRFSYERKFLTGLVKHTVDNRVPQYQDFKCSYSYNSLSRSDLSSTWPKASEIIDIRDQMHKRGWTYFEITGYINGKSVTGVGRIPFVYDMYHDHLPWMSLRVGNDKFIDYPGNFAIAESGKETHCYENETFFDSLSRPWQGLACIDSVRRDAAKHRLRFKTESQNGQATVTVYIKVGDNGPVKDLIAVVYNIDEDVDVIDSIQFVKGKKVLGQLHFNYLQDISTADDNRFIEPQKNFTSEKPGKSENLWLTMFAL